MMHEHDYSGALLFPVRPKTLLLKKLVRDGEVSNGDFWLHSSQGDEEFSDAGSLIDAACEDVETEGTIGLSVGDELIWIHFESGGQLLVNWSARELCERDAVEAVQKLQRSLCAPFAYVARDLWLPTSESEFWEGFQGNVVWASADSPQK